MRPDAGSSSEYLFPLSHYESSTCLVLEAWVTKMPWGNDEYFIFKKIKKLRMHAVFNATSPNIEAASYE